MVIFHSVLSLHNFLQSYTPQKLGFLSKVTTLAMDRMFFFADFYPIYKQYLELPGNFHCGRSVSSHKLVINRDGLQQYIDKPHRNYHQQSARNFFWSPNL